MTQYLDDDDFSQIFKRRQTQDINSWSVYNELINDKDFILSVQPEHIVESDQVNYFKNHKLRLGADTLR